MGPDNDHLIISCESVIGLTFPRLGQSFAIRSLDSPTNRQFDGELSVFLGRLTGLIGV